MWLDSRTCLRRVTSNGKIPSNWPHFWRENDNRTELFIFLADRIVEMCTANVVIATREQDVVSNRAISLEAVAPCSQEEADTWILVYARQAAAEGSKVIMIKACDTYVIVMAVSCFSVLQALGLKELWIAFGQGRNLRWIPVHDLAVALGPDKTSGILFFHSFTGCDVVSAFRGKGKKSAWQTCDVCGEASDIFAKLSKYPPTVQD